MSTIARRHFLRGLGTVAVALPFLESLRPRGARADSGDLAPFAIFMRQGNGVTQAVGSVDGYDGGDAEPERYWPSSDPGPLTKEQLAADTDRVLSVLADHADKLIVLRGIRYPAYFDDCGHAQGGAYCLTAAQLTDDNTNRPLTESIDTRIVRELVGGSAEPLTLYAGAKYGGKDEILSWRDGGDLRGAQNDPYEAYMDLFGLSGLDDDQLAELRKRRQSVNDVVREQMTRLLARKDLSKADRQRLDLHFTSIRDLENGIVCGLSEGAIADMAAIKETVEYDENIELVLDYQSSIIALAVACGVTRAATLQIGPNGDATSYFIDGQMQPSFHKISHRIDSDGDQGAPIENAALIHHGIDKKLHGAFKNLLDKLAAYEMPEGTLLDYGVSVYLSDLADKYHGYERIPYVLAGGAQGALKTGQFLDLGEVVNNKLLSTIGAAVGCKNGNGDPLDDFGDPTLDHGRIDEIVG